MSKHQVVIGRAENIDVVDVALSVPAKIDSGAFRSSLHATDITVVTQGGGKVLKCNLLGHPCYPDNFPYETTQFSYLPIKNSTGDVESRYEIRLKIKIGAKIFNTSFSLSDRSNNVYPVLIGRKALKGRFFINVEQSSVNRMALKELKGVKTVEDEEDLE